MIYNARELRDDMESSLKSRVERMTGSKPCLAIIQVGDSPQSTKYVANKIKALDRVGMTYRHIQFSENCTAMEIIMTIENLNKDRYVHGIMVQLPLPDHLSALTEKILNTVTPVKDVDGLTNTSMGYLSMRSTEPYHRPCTALGVMEILYDINPELTLRGKNVVIIGKGITSGLPLTLMMMTMGANVVNLASGCSVHDLMNYLEKADIVISCVGKPNLIERSDITGPCILVNVGMSVNAEGKLVGDFDPKDFENKKDVTCTSILNSTGIMTVHMLLENLFNAKMWQE